MSISSFVIQQVPVEFADNSPKFIDFLKQYYDWLEDNSITGNITNYKDIIDQYDIVTASDENVPGFIKTYLSNLPIKTSASVRTLLTHVLDLYRTKGTFRSFKLFFRAIFNTDVELYIPNSDVLYVSDSQWRQPQYIEVTEMPYQRLDKLEDFVHQKVVGAYSNASAIVNAYEVKYVNNKKVHILHLSSVVGKFIDGEYFDRYNTVDFNDSPKIKGSLSYVVVQSSSNNFRVGDIVNIKSGGSTARGKVSNIRTESGYLDFEIIDGGSGFSNNTVLVVTGAAPGSVFSPKIDYNDTIQYSGARITNLMNVVINEMSTRLTNPPATDKPFLTATIHEIFNIAPMQVGTIVGIENIQSGPSTSNNISIQVYDPVVSPLNIPASNGGYKGRNAITRAFVLAGQNKASTIDILHSGYGFNAGDRVSFSTGTESGTGIAVTKSQGTSEGYWVTENSHLNSKVLQDGYYFQQYSYEICTNLDPDLYIEAFRLLLHPVGLALYTRFLHKETVVNIPTVVSATIELNTPAGDEVVNLPDEPEEPTDPTDPVDPPDEPEEPPVENPGGPTNPPGGNNTPTTPNTAPTEVNNTIILRDGNTLVDRANNFITYRE